MSAHWARASNRRRPRDGFQVQGDAALVAVEVEKQAAVFGVGEVFKEGGRGVGSAVADSRPFDLNDVGSVVG